MPPAMANNQPTPLRGTEFFDACVSALAVEIGYKWFF